MSSSSMSRDGGAYRRAGLTVALALAALAVIPSTAFAVGTVSTAGTVITYSDDGDGNNLAVTQTATNSYTFTDTAVSIGETSTSCVDNGNNVVCSGTAWTGVTVNLGGGTDSLNAGTVNDDPFTITDSSGSSVTAVNASQANDTITSGDASDNTAVNGITGLSGNAGNDTINGAGGNDTINGDGGNDTLYGGSAGDDDLNGGDGTDRLDGGVNGSSDNDDFDGGLGIDRVVFGIIPGLTYTCTSQAVVITMENTANDSSCTNSSSDTNNVRDSVESVTGSTTSDTITGSCFANTFAGDPGSTNNNVGGADTLNGDPSTGCTAASGSSDFLGGGEGNDIFDGDGTIDGTHFKGFDTVTYGFPYTGHAATTATTSGGSCSTAGSGFAVRVILDATANDCDGFGNTDNVHIDIERLIGSGLADDLDGTGAAQAVSLFGRAGNDVLTDSTFGDFLNGETGADTINCPNGGTDTYVIDGSDTVTGSCEIGT